MGSVYRRSWNYFSPEPQNLRSERYFLTFFFCNFTSFFFLNSRRPWACYEILRWTRKIGFNCAIWMSFNNWLEFAQTCSIRYNKIRMIAKLWYDSHIFTTDFFEILGFLNLFFFWNFGFFFEILNLPHPRRNEARKDELLPSNIGLRVSYSPK